MVDLFISSRVLKRKMADASEGSRIERPVFRPTHCWKEKIGDDVNCCPSREAFLAWRRQIPVWCEIQWNHMICDEVIKEIRLQNLMLGLFQFSWSSQVHNKTRLSYEDIEQSQRIPRV